METKNYLDQLERADFMSEFDSFTEGGSLAIQIGNNPIIVMPPVAMDILAQAKKLRNDPSYAVSPNTDKTFDDEQIAHIERVQQQIKEQVRAIQAAGEPLEINALYSTAILNQKETVSIEDKEAFVVDTYAALEQVKLHSQEQGIELNETQKIMLDAGVSTIGNALSIPSIPITRNNSGPRPQSASITARQLMNGDRDAVADILTNSAPDMADESNRGYMAIAAARIAPTVATITDNEAKVALLTIFERERTKNLSDARTSTYYITGAYRPIEEALNTVAVDRNGANLGYLDNDEPAVTQALETLYSMSGGDFMKVTNDSNRTRPRFAQTAKQ